MAFNTDSSDSQPYVVSSSSANVRYPFPDPESISNLDVKPELILKLVKVSGFRQFQTHELVGLLKVHLLEQDTQRQEEMRNMLKTLSGSERSEGERPEESG